MIIFILTKEKKIKYIPIILIIHKKHGIFNKTKFYYRINK